MNAPASTSPSPAATSIVRVELRGPVAVITMDKPPVNGLGLALRSGLVEAVRQAQSDDNVQALVLAGSARAFSGGADVTEFGTPKAVQEPHLRTVIEVVEGCSKPVVAAIAGVALGGGLELAMACHFRVALKDASLGLPEVKLGLLPGATGTQRLPRLVGVEAALRLIVSGQPVRAGQFAGTPLIDAIAPGDDAASLVDFAVAFAGQVLAEGRPIVRVRDRMVPAPSPEDFTQWAKAAMGSASPHFPAPQQCVEAVARSFSLPFDEGVRLEREAFVALMASTPSRALRHVFAAERAAGKIPDVPEDTPLRRIDRVGVVGAGTMGGGIAMSFANAGIPVVLLEARQEALDKGLATLRKTYQSAVDKGRLTPAQRDERMALVTPTLAYADFRDADLVIEAVFESMEVKQQVFTALDDVLKPGAILASNTSALNLDEIARFTRRPQDVIGLHFFSPAHVMRLLEIVRGERTAKDVLATCMQMARRMKKVAVVSGVCDGFIGNRMLARYASAANGLIVAGALPQQVDGALQDFGMAMGPFRVGDLAGLDIGWAGRKRRQAANPAAYQRIVADLICEAGRFGQKTGAGWYRYEPGQRAAIPDPVVEQLIAGHRRERGVVAREVGDAEVVERCMYALVNEGARILEDGMAARASDIDLVYLNGYGFPLHRGGPMFHANTVGLPAVVAALRRFAAEPGADPSWQPAALLERLAGEGKAFN